MDLAVSDLSVDVIGLCETKLTSNIPFEIPGFNCYRQDKHNSGHGQGVALLIKSDLDHVPLVLPATHQLEAVGIEIILPGKKYTVISIYQSPNANMVVNDLDILFEGRSHVLVMGDFNANHDCWCKVHNPNGRLLFDHMLSSEFIIHASNTPTLVHYRVEDTPTNPDLLLSLNVNKISEIQTITALSSNHLPIFFTVGGPSIRKVTKQFNYSSADWASYRAHLDSNITLNAQILNSPSEIDKAAEYLTHTILNARDTAVPTSTRRDSTPKIPRNLKKWIREKNRLRRHEQRQIDLDLKRVIRTEVNTLNRLIKQSFKQHNDKIWNEKLAKVDNPKSDLWRLCKQLRLKPTIIPPLKMKNGNLTSSTSEQCETLADAFYDNMCLTNNWRSSSQIEDEVAESLRSIDTANGSYTGRLTRPKEVWNHLKNLKRRKAPGVDNIHNALLKNLSQKSVVFLTKIFNSCLLLAHYPIIWKRAKVIALKKPGKDELIPTSYRPISLLSTIGKLFESIIYTRLLQATGHFLMDEQFGFRRQHSTTQQLARVSEHITHNLNLGKSTGMFLLDIEKAFDTVWHAGLLHKMIKSGTPMYLVKLIQSYLSSRELSVHIGKISSSSRTIPAGVPQGSILGPYLFLLYINDMPIQPRTSLACFADDTASLTSSEDVDLVVDRLQLSLDLLFSFFSQWKLKLNETKTEAIMFTRKRSLPRRFLTINGHNIQWSKQIKYLGLLLDNKLNWTPHVASIRNKGQRAMNALSAILNRRSNLSSRTKLLIYSTLVRPCLTYSAPVWGNTCTTNHQKLQIIQNKALKIAFNTPFKTNLCKLHTNINFPTLYEYILKLSKRFYLQKTINHPNRLVSHIGRSRAHDLRYIDRYNTYRLPHHYVLHSDSA